ncbi:MAG: ABC transporter permease subunit [Streptosporangiales bacterium]|nr:ABC transporter permease subunit [Streptosporangiales bacterium]
MGVTRYTVTSFYTGEAPFVGLANYLSVARDALLDTAFINTAIFTVGSIVPQFSIGLALAVFFQRHFPLNRTLRALLLLPWLLPLVVAGTVYRWILDQDYGVVNQVLLQLHVISEPVPWLTSPGWALASVIIANIWAGIPFNLVVLYSGLEGIPRTLYEAAAVDGARAWRQFWHITLPLLRPVSAIALMLGLIYTIKVFDIIMILTNGGPADSTQTLATWAYFLSFIDLSFGKGAAVGNILILITLVFAAFYLRSARAAFR